MAKVKRVPFGRPLEMDASSFAALCFHCSACDALFFRPQRQQRNSMLCPDCGCGSQIQYLTWFFLDAIHPATSDGQTYKRCNQTIRGEVF